MIFIAADLTIMVPLKEILKFEMPQKSRSQFSFLIGGQPYHLIIMPRCPTYMWCQTSVGSECLWVFSSPLNNVRLGFRYPFLIMFRFLNKRMTKDGWICKHLWKNLKLKILKPLKLFQGRRGKKYFQMNLVLACHLTHGDPLLWLSLL